MTQLTFYGGVEEVGGNKILLEDGGTRVFLDFGKAFGREKQFYDEPYVAPREEKHLLNLGLLPKIDGLYKNDEEPKIDGVLVTHPHLDHWGYTCYLDNRIPIYCGETAKEIIINYEFSSSVAPSKDYNLASLTKSRGEEIFKDFRTFRTGERVSVGSIDFEPVHVDHSIPGAYGFVIYTSTGSIVYTGDLRFHGPRGDMTEDFVERAEESEPQVMITEATNITGASPSSEAEVEKKLGHVMKSSSGLVVISFSNRDADRLRSAYRAAKKNGRKLAVSMKQAFMLLALAEDPHLDLFDLSDPDVLVFRRRKERVDAWEEGVLDVKEAHHGSSLNEVQEKVVLVASLYDMNELMDIDPMPGSIFVLSQSEPFDEEGEIQHEKLLNWCDHYGMPQYRAHASGHIMPNDLKSMIDRIGPRKVLPVHTERPAQLKKFISNLECEVELPRLGETITLADIS